MGVFTDVAIGGLQGLQAVAERDAATNATMANISLDKENQAFAKTENAFNNRKQIYNIVRNNPQAFGITPGELTVDQISDRLVGKIFNEQRSLFEYDDINDVKKGVANWFARNPGADIELTSPYVPSEDLFNAEKQKHAAKLSAISKMPQADKLLMNIDQAEASVATPDAITDQLTRVASITAKGYGILNTFPGTVEGNANLNFMKVNIITANAKAQFPNDSVARSDFIDKKLYENNINPLDALNFSSPMTFKAMSQVLDASGTNIAAQIAQLNLNIANAENDEERQVLVGQVNNLMLSQLGLIDQFSRKSSQMIVGRDRADVFKETPKVEPVKYTPDMDGLGNINLPQNEQGVSQVVPIMDFIKDPRKLSDQPIEVQNYVNTVKERFFDDKGNMMMPKREQFIEGPQGDERFKNFMTFYNRMQPVDMEEGIQIGGYGFIDTPERTETEKKETKKKETPRTFKYKGKEYKIPDDFIGKNLPEFLKKAIAENQDRK